uniref:Uncharacterized protein n=1 Tax=Picea glauca TaxID=3330 RepID=A0A101LUT0_PICGL|nr:hypothetical protein ABT39_MTgene2296 [Picea glauca]QHR87958.1 hypothetical protein Q903MT_gene1970 [Picea sitchensis]
MEDHLRAILFLSSDPAMNALYMMICFPPHGIALHGFDWVNSLPSLLP